MHKYSRQEMALLRRYDPDRYDEYVGRLDNIAQMANQIADIAIEFYDKPEVLAHLANIADDEWYRYVTAIRHPGDREKLAALC